MGFLRDLRRDRAWPDPGGGPGVRPRAVQAAGGANVPRRQGGDRAARSGSGGGSPFGRCLRRPEPGHAQPSGAGRDPAFRRSGAVLGDGGRGRPRAAGRRHHPADPGGGDAVPWFSGRGQQLRTWRGGSVHRVLDVLPSLRRATLLARTDECPTCGAPIGIDTGRICHYCKMLLPRPQAQTGWVVAAIRPAQENQG